MSSKRIIVGVLGLPVNKHGQFLVTLRNDHYEKTHNKWQIAGGGMEFGETPEQTLMRELHEELGVQAKIICDKPIVVTQTWAQPEKSSHIVLIAYVVDIGNQQITLDGEASEYTWVTSQNLEKEHCLPSTPEIVQKAEVLVEQFDLLARLGE